MRRFCAVHVAMRGSLHVVGGSLTSGFPSLEELRANGSLVDRYSTHDGERRSVPGFRTTCSGRISRIAIIALPGNGTERPMLRFVRYMGAGNHSHEHKISLGGTLKKFGTFGYEISHNPPMMMGPMFHDGDMLEIRHPPYEDSDLRLLHQVGTDARNICWSIEPDGSENCQSDYDYPLLAIETGRYGCRVITSTDC